MAQTSDPEHAPSMIRTRTSFPSRASILLLMCLAAQGSAEARNSCLPPSASPALEEQESLEQFLERMRQAREVAFEIGRARVADLMKRLETNPKSPSESSKVRAELVKLGPELAPLLVPYLDPGAKSGRGELHRATQVMLVLRLMSSEVVTEELLAQAKRGTPSGRRNAVMALRGCPESAKARVIEDLHQIYSLGTAEVRGAALSTLAALGGERVNQLFIQALAEADEDLVSAALQALTRSHNEAVADKVLQILEGPAAGTHAPEVLQYFLAIPGRTKSKYILGLLRAIDQGGITRTNQRGMLNLMRHLDFELDNSIEAALAPFYKASQVDLVDAARILAASKGNRAIKKQLLDERNAVISAQKNWPRGYSARGDIYYKIGEYRLALRDYRQSAKLSKDRVDTDVQLSIARCLSLQGKHKDAASELNRSNASIRTLMELGRDPDFLEMAQNSRYRTSVFRLPPLEDQ